VKFKSLVKGDKHFRVEIPHEVAEELQLRRGSPVAVGIDELEDDSEEE
jgi:bifunctional DNA-binding transcriptional regulator/antitoxin component of YhaV-PrlF toxin-antitoxin module